MAGKKQSKSLPFEDKWPPEIAAVGYTQVPNYLLLHQSELGLTKSELVILLHLMTFDYGSRTAWPSHNTLAKRIGIKSSSVRHNIASLAKKGFINRNFRQGDTNEYDLLPIIAKLRDLSYIHPVKNQTGAYQKPGRPPPQKNDTKEYQPKRNNKTESVMEIINERFKVINNG